MTTPPALTELDWLLFDWGDTLMADLPGQTGPMWQWPQVQLIPGALELLQWLQGRVKIGLTSNARESDEGAIRRALARVGLAPLIQQIWCRQRLGCGKGDAQFWQQLIADTGSAPWRLLHLGNDPVNDVAMPRCYQLQALWLVEQGRGMETDVWHHQQLLDWWRLTR
ncbi:MAG: HAD family hydrolase [Gammaproteobacteria bacterium]|nr:HAD family hydrolase [Gammaproteobacteria bacterium]